MVGGLRLPDKTDQQCSRRTHDTHHVAFFSRAFAPDNYTVRGRLSCIPAPPTTTQYKYRKTEDDSRDALRVSCSPSPNNAYPRIFARLARTICTCTVCRVLLISNLIAKALPSLRRFLPHNILLVKGGRRPRFDPLAGIAPAH